MLLKNAYGLIDGRRAASLLWVMLALSGAARADMPGMLGVEMTREGSGTSWQPAASPMTGSMWSSGAWELMAHGSANLIYDHQGGTRGDSKTFVNSMAMLMASTSIGSGTLGLRTMLSLDPLMGKSGYPLLLQAGETADGRHTLIDRQHPHDAFMELATSYTLPLAAQTSAYIYLGLPGEPALGPSTFMHRFSGADIPEAPLTHHWLDSTHITFGVATLGLNWQRWKFEGSVFNGREPDQYRWNIETRHFDSASARLSFNPDEHWSVQVSNGFIKSPEQLEPDVSVHRTTASASYQHALAGGDWGSTVAWGRNKKNGEAHNGYLLESTFALPRNHTVFGRIERVENDELFNNEESVVENSPNAEHGLHGEVFTVDKLSLGYIYDFARSGAVHWGIGALVSTYRLPSELHDSYGSRPISSMVFLRVKL